MKGSEARVLVEKYLRALDELKGDFEAQYRDARQVFGRMNFSPDQEVPVEVETLLLGNESKVGPERYAQYQKEPLCETRLSLLDAKKWPDAYGLPDKYRIKR